MSSLLKKYKETIVPELSKQFQYSSIMQVPRFEKIVLNYGSAEASANPKQFETAMEEMGLITGQRPVKTIARKSIAGFKVREGMVLGCKVTLRGQRMFEFLERLIHISLPRVRDFKGLNPTGFDGRGNYNLSVKEQIIFAEIDVDKVQTYHGLNITIVTTAPTNEEAHALLSAIGMPFKKAQAK